MGTGIGTLSTPLGIGGGMLTVPLQVYCNVPIHQAVGTSAACGLPISLAGVIGFAVASWGEVGPPAGSSGYPYWPAVAAVVAGSAFLPPRARLAHALPVTIPHRGFMAVVARRIAVSRRLVCCSPEYARRAGLAETIEALAHHACIGYANAPANHLGNLNPASPPARHARRSFGAGSS